MYAVLDEEGFEPIKLAVSGLVDACRRRDDVAKLATRLREELGDWREHLPPVWRLHFGGMELDFDEVDSELSLTADSRIWPQARNKDAGGPANASVFRAFMTLAPEDVRVVIFGNDPYTRIEQATGRSFEQGDLSDWKQDLRVVRRVSPSLKSILCAAAATAPGAQAYHLVDRRAVVDYKPKTTVEDALGPDPVWFCHTELEHALLSGDVRLPSPTRVFDYWTKQGVLWLNRTLTYTKWDDIEKLGHRRSHQRMWKPFTDRTIEVLVGLAMQRPIVFVFWGGEARELRVQVREVAQAKGASQQAVRETVAGHPQWPPGYFQEGNPLAAINEAIGSAGAPIRWA
jgi:uracil-DNA glycosylase